jgi:hypothetical protein
MCEQISALRQIQTDIEKDDLQEDEISLIWFLGLEQWQDMKKVTFKTLEYKELWDNFKKKYGNIQLLNSVIPDSSIKKEMEKLENSENNKK